MTSRSLSVAQLGVEIDAGRIDPRRLTEEFLMAIDDHAHGTRIFARLTADRARAEADAAADRARRGMRLGPCDGVPLSWKDLFDTSGVATEAGSGLLKGRIPGRDARVLRAATAAGAICLGKTHMTELAFAGLGYNPITATPPNIHDPAALPGGSSSGAAASVAFDLAPAAIGTDTGGSVRVPAAWNDLVGLRTTPLRLSTDGVVPLCPRFDTVGPLCRSVEDAALVLSALEGGRPVSLTGADLGGARFAVLRTTAFDAIRDAPRAAFEEAIARLGARGAQIEDIEAPEVAHAMTLAPALFGAEAWGTWRDTIQASPDTMFANTRLRFESGAAVSGADYVAAWQALDRLRETWQRRTVGFDAILLPTSPILPPRVDEIADDPDHYAAENLLTLRNTRIGNLMGVPALTLPTGTAACGLMLMAAPWDDARLLRTGRAVEAALA